MRAPHLAVAVALALALALALAGCNQLLGNRDFRVEAGANDAGADACTGATCASHVDASMACEQMGLPPTTIAGTVLAPNGTLPLSDVTVYVATQMPDAITAGVTCGTCASDLTGDPLVTTRTDATGHFELDDVPVGDAEIVVIQIGRWRRVVTVATHACTTTTLTPAQSRLPRTRAEGDLPRIAIVTGVSDSLECLVRRLGIDDTEITTSPGAGRVHLFRGNGAGSFDAGFPTLGAFAPASSLLSSPAALDDYDLLLFGCDSSPDGATPVITANLVDYANKGGRVMFVHDGSKYLRAATPWSGLATFDPDGPLVSPARVVPDTSFAAGQRFAAWLGTSGVASGGGVTLTEARSSCTATKDPRVRSWATLDPEKSGGASGVQLFTFAAPIGAPAAGQCGRVTFTDVHEGSPAAQTFPTECGPAGAQDALLAFALFQLSSCVE